jgi:hypothetical protein
MAHEIKEKLAIRSHVSYIDETVGNVQAPVAERPVGLSPQP